MRDQPLRVTVLISGGGSTLANLVERTRDGRLRGVSLAGVISSRSRVRGVDIAREAGLPLTVVRPIEFPDVEAFSRKLAEAIDATTPHVVAMGGFLSLWRIPAHLAGRVLNIHPALLPGFGGKGMYGRRVHEAVLAAGERESGCTVHLADDIYDHGPIVAQRRVPVHGGDTPDTLAERVGAAERELYPAVLQCIADGGVGVLNRLPLAL